MHKLSQIKSTFTMTKDVLDYDSGHTEDLCTAQTT